MADGVFQLLQQHDLPPRVLFISRELHNLSGKMWGPGLVSLNAVRAVVWQEWVPWHF